MPRIVVAADEWYPVHVIEEPGGHYAEIDVDDATLARWRAGFEAFAKLQAEIEAAARPTPQVE